MVADAVNNAMVARQGWVILAGECAVPLRFVQVVCSDKSEHRRRVETRTAEMPGYRVPTWQQVQPPVGATVRAASRHRQRRRPRWIDWLTQPRS